MAKAALSSAHQARVVREQRSKLHRILVTPEGVGLNVHIATAGARMGALFIDITIIFGLFLALLFGILFIGWAYATTGLPEPSQGFGEMLVVVLIITVFLARNAYFLYFELGSRSATWGKRMVGIRVAARDGGRLTADAIIARNLVRDIEMFLPLIFMTSGGVQGQLTSFAALAGSAWVGVFLLFPLFNKDRLRVGDLIAGTWVVQTNRSSLGSVVAGTGATMLDKHKVDHSHNYRFNEEELSVYGEYELQMLEQVLRNDNVDALETVCASICGKIGWNPGAGDERAFLEAYYTQLRARLERNMRFGKRRADKFSDAH